MDYLPIQATSVPCERMFSSAKETDTAKQNRISPVLMEALQLLKFSLKKECLNFMAGWSTPENAMSGACKPNPGLLGGLFMEDPDAVMDNILNEFSVHDGNS
jgi:hAT family C-terminal dimerisation region